MKFDYTASVRKYAFEHPLLSSILIQINFWVVAFLLLGFILHLSALASEAIYSPVIRSSSFPILAVSVTSGLFYGLLLGVSDHYFNRKWFKRKSSGVMMILKSVYYLFVMLIIFIFIRRVVWQLVLVPHYFPQPGLSFPEETWTYYFYITLIYVFFMGMVISFIGQINSKFGPGVLIPLLLGKYAQPQEEERAFIFLDLKSSTSHAETLGHVRYSNLISDCFRNINRISIKYNAEIYQYVGDEVVLSWPVHQLRDLGICIDFFFACRDDFEMRKPKFLKKYKIAPEFKAGLHFGVVTAVEVGDVKREIAFHGDTLNVAARIQEKCNECNADLIISEDVKERLTNPAYKMISFGPVALKGRKERIEIYGVLKNET